MRRVMLFDEPTSALDPEIVGEVLEAMVSLAEEGRTMLGVTHEMGFAHRGRSRHFHGRRPDRGDERAIRVLSNPQHERTKLFLGRILH